jgi:hypothetical protein
MPGATPSRAVLAEGERHEVEARVWVGGTGLAHITLSRGRQGDWVAVGNSRHSRYSRWWGFTGEGRGGSLVSGKAMKPRRVGQLGVLLLLGATAPVQADVFIRAADGRVDITANASPLRAVLDAFAKQTGAVVTYEGRPHERIVTVNIVGRAGVGAVTELLEGTGLNYILRSDTAGTGVEALHILETASGDGPSSRMTMPAAAGGGHPSAREAEGAMGTYSQHERETESMVPSDGSPPPPFPPSPLESPTPVAEPAPATPQESNVWPPGMSPVSPNELPAADEAQSIPGPANGLGAGASPEDQPPPPAPMPVAPGPVTALPPGIRLTGPLPKVSPPMP